MLEEAGEDMTPTEVAGALGKCVNTVKQTLWRMSNDGQLTSSGGRNGVADNPGNPVTDDAESYRVTAVTGYADSVASEIVDYEQELEYKKEGI